MNFEYTSEPNQSTIVFHLKGEIIDKNQASGFLEEISNLVAAGKNKFILELSALKYMNSSGLNVLVNTLTKARNAGGEVAVCNVSKKVNELLVITKLDSIFQTVSTLDEALKKFK